MSLRESKQSLPDAKFRFRFSPLMLAVFALMLALCCAGIGLTTWQLVEFLQGDISSVYNWLKYFIMYFVSIFLLVLIISMLVRSQYVVTQKQMIMQFGIIRTRYELKKIYSVKLFRGSNRLTVYFDDYKTNYTVIVVKEEWYNDFVKALTDRNERITFDFITAEEEDEWKNRKKK